MPPDSNMYSSCFKSFLILYLSQAMTSAVIEDRRSSALQLMSVGEVRRILSNCTEYWDGADIMPLVDDVRKSLLDTHQQWNLADCDATACAYFILTLISFELVFKLFAYITFVLRSCVHSDSFFG